MDSFPTHFVQVRCVFDLYFGRMFLLQQLRKGVDRSLLRHPRPLGIVRVRAKSATGLPGAEFTRCNPKLEVQWFVYWFIDVWFFSLVLDGHLHLFSKQNIDAYVRVTWSLVFWKKSRRTWSVQNRIFVCDSAAPLQVSNLCFLCAVSPSEGSAWFAEGPSSRWWMAFFCGRRKFTCMDGLRSSLFLVLRHETDAWIRFSGGHRWLCFSMSICQSSSAGTKDHSHWSYGQGSF